MNEQNLYIWLAILAIVVATTLGDILMARAMRRIGDVSDIYQQYGLRRVLAAVLGNGGFYLALFFLAISFFSTMVALSWGNLSLVLPAGTSLTFLTNTVTAKYFLKERVDSRRWMAALCVFTGMLLLNS